MKFKPLYIVIIVLLQVLCACTIIPIKNDVHYLPNGKITASAVVDNDENMDRYMNTGE